VLFNGTVGEQDAQRCEELAERISKLRDRHDTAEIALMLAKALLNATVGERDAQRSRRKRS
jgi:hypothetical protein